MKAILLMSYWEQFNWEKELSKSYPIDSPIRIKAHENTNKALELVNDTQTELTINL